MRFKKKPGRVKQRLAAMLGEEGYGVEPEELHDTTGYYRINGSRDDQLRWEAWASWAQATPIGFSNRHLISDSRMTDCVRYGFDISHDSGNMFWVDARRPVSSPTNTARTEE